MKKSEQGFGLLEILIAFIIITAIGLLGFFVFSRINNSDEYNGNIGLFLSGATDDKYDNYYKLGFTLEDILTGCSINNIVDVKTDTIYTNGQLQLKIYAYVQKTEYEGEVTCDAVPQPYQGSIDIKEYLKDKDSLEIIVSNKKHKIYIDNTTRTLKLDKFEPIPYYPDKIAILSTYPCDSDSTKVLSNFAEANGLIPADPIYPGLNNLYRRPTKELHVIFDDKVKELEQQSPIKYSDTLNSPQCTPAIFKPILKNLSDQLSP